MQGKEKAELSDFLLLSKEPIIVRSAFDLQDSQHAEIQNTIQETFSSALPIRFETEPGLISGIEMIANGYKIAWNIEDYLLALETGVEELLKDKKIEIPKPEPVHE
jgi:F-type H+-transporting ATPase subunit b